MSGLTFPEFFGGVFPPTTDTAKDVTYGPLGSDMVGVLEVSAGADYPANADVRAGVVFANGTREGTRVSEASDFQFIILHM